MKTLILAAFAAALPLHADTLAEVRAAVTALHGTQPIRATAELHRTDNDQGRFTNEKFSGAATVDMALDGEGVHLSFSNSMVEQFRREEREKTADPKKVDPVSRTASDVGPLWVLQHLNATETFLGMLKYAKLESEARAAWQSHPARLLVFRLNEPVPEGLKGLGSFDVKEDRLRLWIGDDNLPLAAEHVQNATIRFLFFHGFLKVHEAWSFTRASDHLVVSRHDSSHNAEMLGQKSAGDKSTVVTLR